MILTDFCESTHEGEDMKLENCVGVLETFLHRGQEDLEILHITKMWVKYKKRFDAQVFCFENYE